METRCISMLRTEKHVTLGIDNRGWDAQERDARRSQPSISERSADLRFGASPPADRSAPRFGHRGHLEPRFASSRSRPAEVPGASRGGPSPSSTASAAVPAQYTTGRPRVCHLPSTSSPPRPLRSAYGRRVSRQSTIRRRCRGQSDKAAAPRPERRVHCRDSRGVACHRVPLWVGAAMSWPSPGSRTSRPPVP